MNYWLVLTNEQNWEKIRNNNLYAFENPKKINLINKGDKIVVYIIRSKIGGIFEVIDKETTKKISFLGGKFDYFITLKPEIIPNDPLDLTSRFNNPELIGKISIFPKVKKWAASLMGKSIVKINYEDYLLFDKKLRELKK